MNIHVFYVNRGDMLTYDTHYSVERLVVQSWLSRQVLLIGVNPSDLKLFCRVQKLQELICRDTCIPEESQVLLINGGEMLIPTNRTCGYSAGTVSHVLHQSQ